LRFEILEDRWLLTTVTNLLDDGSAGSLRGAIQATPTGGTVDFDPTLSSGTIRLVTTRGALTINKNLTITGPSAISITVSGRETPTGTTFVQDFNIGAGFTVAISNLTITEGQGTDGGGIVNRGTFTLTNSTVTGNSTTTNGGGIWNSGTATLINDTIAGNQATGNGGGIFTSGAITLTNDTIAGNSTASGGMGGGLFITSGTSATLKNTIVATNTSPTGPDISGAVTTANNNLVGDGTGSTGVVNGVNGNLVGTTGSPINPLLGTLQNNGGPTFTRALLTGSPAIDAGTNTGVPTTDQRGFNRTVNNTTDMGAYEFQPPATTTGLMSGTNPSTLNQQVTFTATVSGNAPGSNTPTGTVTFFDSSTILGTGTLSASGTPGQATATFTISTLTVGSHSITARYNGVTIGDFHFDMSTSGATNQVVNRGNTTTMLGNMPNPSTVNQTVTFTATVTPVIPGTPAPGGSVTFMEGSTVLGNAFLMGTTATFTISTLTAGTHSNITAHYNGDGNYAESTSSAVSQTVMQATTTTMLVISPNPATVGQTVTFTATVATGATGTLVPTGTVTFRDGSTILGTGTVTGNTATFTSSTLMVGTHPITATYNGDTNFLLSGSASQNLMINLVGTTTTLASLPNPSTANQPVTFTATVTPASGTTDPTGTVTFLEGSTILGTGTVNSRMASVTIANLTAMGHSITARYNGDTTFNPSTSAAITQTVNMGNTTTALVGNPSPVQANVPVMFTATVSPATPGPLAPTGTVTFLEGATILGTGTVGTGGIATFTTSFSMPAVHIITARYNADSNFNTSSGTFNEVVQNPNPTATTTTLNSSPNPSTVNQMVTFTASVMPQSGTGTPTGTVQFRDGSTILGTGTLTGGSTSIMVSNLTAGAHSITASYSGDVNFGASTSTARTQTVNQSGTTTTLAPLSPSTVGQPVTFTATVTPAVTGTLVPTGTVTFFDGGTVLGTGTVTSGMATFTTSSLAAGTHPITATYNGDVNFASSTSSPPQNQVVNRVGTTVTLVGIPNPSTVNQTITFQATVAPVSGTGTPSGTVTFREGSTILGTGTLSGRIATITVSNLPAGPHMITATYSGDTMFAPPDNPTTITQTVNKADTNTSLTSSPNPSAAGNFVVFTATVTAVTPGFFAPTGTVNFLDGTTVIGTATLMSGPGGTLTATFTTTFTTQVIHSITARYAGDTNFNLSTSNAVSQDVRAPATIGTTTTLSAGTPNPSTVNQSVSFTITVTPASGTADPTGSVTLLDGATILGTGNLSGRTATVQVANLTAGSHTITARYNGDLTFITSVSSGQSQTVNRANSTTTLVSSMNPSMVGQAVTFTATVTPGTTGPVMPSGSVTFLDGTTVLGTGTLTAAGGMFTATFTTSGLTAGSHSITARYEGDTNFNTSTSSAVNQVVGQGTTTNLVSSQNPSGQNQPVTFTATVMPTSGTGTPTGTVTFLDGTTVLGTGTLTSGTATFTFMFTTTGTHPITARYNGDSTFSQSTSSVVNQVVNPGVTVTVTGNPNPSGVNQQVTFTATVTPQSGTGTPTGTVTFLDGTNIIGTGTLTSGMTSIMFTFTTTGMHVITARYNGDSTFGPGSGTVNQIVSQPTATMLTSSLNPSGFNQAVTFTATVTPTSGSGIPNGTVTFLDGTTVLGTGTLANGIATFTTSTLSVATHPITARYNPADATFLTSTSTVVNQVVNQFGVNAMVTSGTNPSNVNQQVTFTATITAIGTTAQTPTGSVSFREGSTILGTGTLSGTGGTATATFNFTFTTPGNHPITIVYAGDTNFGSGTATVNQVVNPTGTTTSTSLLTSAPNPSGFGQAVTFTATVTGAGGTPTGTVAFLEGTTVLGTGALTLVGGTPTATFTTTTLSLGSHIIVARYSGDSTFASSTSTAVNQVVSQTTATTLVSSLNPSAVNQSVTFTATVSSVGTSQAPTGTVTFLDGTTILGTGALTPGTGGNATATFTTTTLALGSHTLTARYNPADTTFLTSTSAALTQQVVQFQANITSVIGNPNPANPGQQVTFTVTIMGQGTTQTPTGTVTFRDGTTLLGTATVSGTGSTVTATFMFTFTTMGMHIINVNYSGDTNFSAANGSVTETILGGIGTTTALVSSINPSGVGQAVTFTATVTPASGTTSPTGTVTFLDGTTILGTGTLSGTGGTATTTFMFTFTSPAAIHPITARYNGDSTFASSTSMVVNQDVRLFSVTVTGAGSPNPSNPGQQVTITATVMGNTTTQTPSGSVVFRDGTTILGTSTLSGTGGTATATLQISTLMNGSHTITVSYGGDTNFGSGMGTYTQNVGVNGTTTTLTTSLNFAITTRPVTFTATVTATTGTGTPTGTVTFRDGTTILGTGTLTAGGTAGTATATFTTSTLALGAHSITAQYNGDTTFGGSTSAALREVIRSGLFFAVGGSSNRVQVRRVADNSIVADFAPFASTFTGPVNVAVGDIEGNGMEDIVVSAGLNSPHVKVYRGSAFANGTFSASNPDASLLVSFFAYGTIFNVGANVAVADVNGDGFADLITGATLGNPHVKVYDGQSIVNGTFATNPEAHVVASWFAYTININLGANVAGGDVTKSGFADVITGATSGNPNVIVWNGQTMAAGTFGNNPSANERISFMAFTQNLGIGAFVSFGVTTTSGFGDIIVGQGGNDSEVKVFSGQSIANGTFSAASALDDFFAFESGAASAQGVSVGAADFDHDGNVRIITGNRVSARYRVVPATSTGRVPTAFRGIDTTIPSPFPQGGLSVSGN
jgi:predicted outer membrane repeat protein